MSRLAEPAFAATNNSLRALQATLGNSYKCNSEEHVRVTPAFSLSIFRVWVQAFRVKDNKFGSGECSGLGAGHWVGPGQGWG